MEIVDVGVLAVAEVPVRVVDFGQRLLGTVGTSQKVQEVELRSSKAGADHVHWKAEEWVEGIVEGLVVEPAPAHLA